MLTWSPTFSCPKFFTSGEAVTVTSLPCGPFSVMSRVVGSIAVMVAVTFIVCAAPAIPGPLPTTAVLGLRGDGRGKNGRENESDESCKLLHDASPCRFLNRMLLRGRCRRYCVVATAVQSLPGSNRCIWLALSDVFGPRSAW